MLTHLPQVLQVMAFLANNHIMHFDIKCDNFLLDPIDRNCSEADFINQKSEIPNFEVHVADFGEAKIWHTDEEAYTFRNRGTEFTKSPEMLQVAYASQKTRATYDRRRKVGASAASDIWSLGCLFYELLTGDFLFYDNDWVRFFIRVTSPQEVRGSLPQLLHTAYSLSHSPNVFSQQLILPEKKMKINNNPVLIDFLEFMLLRDSLRRPTIHDCITRFNYILGQLSTNNIRFNSPRKMEQQQRSSPFKGSFIGGAPQSSGKGAAEASKAAQAGGLAQVDELVIPKANYGYVLSESRYFTENATKITEHLYIGSYVASLNKEKLKNQLDITYIINCTEAPNAFPGHFEYLQLRMVDEPRQDLLGHLDAVFSFLQEAQKNKGNVFIHSEKGQSRCAALAMYAIHNNTETQYANPFCCTCANVVLSAYIMQTMSLQYYEAYIYVKDRRYSINPNRGFKRQLSEWGEAMRKAHAASASVPLSPSPSPVAAAAESLLSPPGPGVVVTTASGRNLMANREPREAMRKGLAVPSIQKLRESNL